MNRRKFLTSSATSLAAVAVLTVVPLTLTGCDTSWIQTAIDDLPTIDTILQSVAAIALDATGNGILDVAAQAIIQAAVGTATVALNAVETAIAAYKANPSASTLADINAALISLQPQLTSILSAVYIKDPALIATISGAVNLAISVIASIQLLLPSASASVALKAQQPVKLLKPSEIAAQFNVLVTTNGYGKHKIPRRFLGF